jgi:hypothetical protein
VARASESPFGRYHLRDADSTAALHDVQVLGVPTDLYFQTRQQHDDLVREFAVMGLAHGEQDLSQPAGLRQLIRELGVTFTRTESRANEDVEAAARAGATSMDLRYLVPATVVEGADRLESMMARADDFCRQGLMLTMPRSPQMLAFSRWWLEEFRRQVAGRPPIPWPASSAGSDQAGDGSGPPIG